MASKHRKKLRLPSTEKSCDFQTLEKVATSKHWKKLRLLSTGKSCKNDNWLRSAHRCLTHVCVFFLSLKYG